MSSNPYRDHYSSEGQTQISARMDDDLKADIEQLADDRGINQGDLIEEACAKEVADAGMIDAGEVVEPEDSIEKDLYQTLIDIVETGKFVGLKPVRSIISQESQVPSDKIPMWIERLMKRGFAQLRASAPGTDKTRYAIAVKPPEAEPFEWTVEDPDPDDEEVTNADDKIDEISSDDAEPITDADEDPITDDTEIESDDDHVLGFDVTVETDPEPDSDETDDGKIVSDGGIRLVDYYRGIYQLENGQPIPVEEIDLIDSKLNEIKDQGWIDIENENIYCKVVPQDRIRIDDRNFETLGEKKREHFRREGMSYDSYLRNQKNLTPDPTRLVIDQTPDPDDATKVAADGGTQQ